MAKPAKRKIEGGRVTPRATSATPSARYTPPVTRKQDMPSPMWVPVLMFALLGLGILTIVLNYVSLLPGGEVNNWYLVLG
ncbi:MAG: cell division protein CrgA, partial [Actinobacteria bacterium]